MEERRFARTFAQYVSLNVLGMLGLSCYILADTYFIADRLGAEGLAALNLAIPAYSVVSGLGLMLGVGGATRYALLKARGEQKNANAVFTHAAVLALGAGALLLLAGQLCSGPISCLLGASGAVLPLTQVYLRTVLSFAPCFLLNNVLLAFVRNDGGPRLAMAAMLLGSFSNILLDWVLMYACGMGMFGAAFATGLAPVISMALMVFHFPGKRGALRTGRLRLGRTARAL